MLDFVTVTDRVQRLLGFCPCRKSIGNWQRTGAVSPTIHIKGEGPRGFYPDSFPVEVAAAWVMMHRLGYTQREIAQARATAADARRDPEVVKLLFVDQRLPWQWSPAEFRRVACLRHYLEVWERLVMGLPLEIPGDFVASIRFDVKTHRLFARMIPAECVNEPEWSKWRYTLDDVLALMREDGEN